MPWEFHARGLKQGERDKEKSHQGESQGGSCVLWFVYRLGKYQPYQEIPRQCIGKGKQYVTNFHCVSPVEISSPTHGIAFLFFRPTQGKPRR